MYKRSNYVTVLYFEINIAHNVWPDIIPAINLKLEKGLGILFYIVP